jgi:hypothetical protein
VNLLASQLVFGEINQQGRWFWGSAKLMWKKTLATGVCSLNSSLCASTFDLILQKKVEGIRSLLLAKNAFFCQLV